MEKIRKKYRRLEETIDKFPITMAPNKIINEKTKVFTIGSCFAYEIQNYLLNKKYNVYPPISDGIEQNLIWYNTYSILYEFEKAAGMFAQTDDDIWTLKNEHQDPYRRCVFGKTKKEVLNKIRKLDSIIKEHITNCEVLIMTLGLVEVWIKPNGRVSCCEPGYPKGRGGGQDCKFKFSNYDENLSNMVNAIAWLKTINPNCKVIITTSPVPLGMTFRKMDHCIANMESKSILRSVCGELERQYKNVVYYPSYEIAMLSNKKHVFKPDGRHVKPEFVAKIMSHFESIFMEIR